MAWSILSIVIAVLASYTALDLAGRVAVADGKRRRVWIGGGALAMGFGIWSMHFTAMLAYELPVPVRYGWALTAVSLLIAISFSAAALHLMGRSAVPLGLLVAAGLGIGTAIAGMHYTGMAAVRVPGALRYDPRLVTASIAIALVAAVAALWLLLHFRFRTGLRAFAGKSASAAVMGAAITGLHYTGMAGVAFVPAPGARAVSAADALARADLAVAVVAGTLVILALARLAVLADRDVRPLQVLAATAALAGLLFGGLGWAAWGLSKSFKEVQTASVTLQKRIGRMDLLDEALTMSARMAAATGDPAWEARYERLDAELATQIDALLREAEPFVPPLVRDQLRTVNDSLLAMETRAFTLVRTGQRERAAALLGAPAYVQQKQSYAALSATIVEALRERTAEENEHFSRRLAIVGMLLTLLLASLVLSALFLRRTILAADAQRSRDEAALRAQDQRFRGMTENASDLVTLLDADGGIQYESPAAERILGYAPDELVGRSAFELVHPDDLARVVEAFGRALQDPEFRVSLEYRFLHGDGSWRVLESVGNNLLADPVVGAFVVNSRDVTERRVAEEAVERSEAHFRALIENASDVITIMAADGTIQYESPSIERVLGYSPEELVGTDGFALVHPDDVGVAQAAFGRRLEDPDVVQSTRYRFRHKDGSWRVMEATGRNHLADPAVRGVVLGSRDVTERQRAEEADQRLAAIVRSSDDAIISKSLDGTLLSWNRGAERIFGYAADKVIGRSIELLLPPDRADEEKELLGRIARGEEIAQHETVRMTAAGRAIDVSLSIAPVRDGSGRIVAASSIARDITERKQAERELQASNERYSLVGRVTQEAIWDWHIAEEQLLWGDGICRTFGYDEHEVRSDPVWWSERIHPDDLARVSKSLDAALAGQGEYWGQQYRFLCANGEYAEVEDRGLVIRDAEGPAFRMIGSLADITERKRAEREMRASKEAAEAANRAKSDFLSSMSHELRTPLNSVIGFANVLGKNKRGNLAPQDLSYLERILANGKHLLGLINDVLDLSKIEAGKMELDLAPVALDALVRDTLSELSGAVRDKDVELRQSIPANVAPVEADAGKLKQILVNLIGNAIKFTGNGSVRVSVEVEPATTRPLRIEVADTGIGIPPERLGSIFDAFEQAERGTSRRYGGTGLGLAISSSLAALMGFRLEVRSTPGEGSVFTLHLDGAAPAEGEPHAEPSQVASPEAPAPPAAGGGTGVDEDATLLSGSERRRKQLVLAIDDETDARMLLTHHLEDLGYDAITASSGEQGMRMAREFRPDLITLDLLLPGVTGWEILAALKSDADLCEIPVIIVSVVAEENRGHVLGAVDLLEKAIEQRTLDALLQRHLPPNAGGRVLVVDDDAEGRRALAATLREAGLTARSAVSAEDALRVLEHFTPDLIILDLVLPGSGGLDLLRQLQEHPFHRRIAVVISTEKELSRDEVRELSRQAIAILKKDNELGPDLRAVVEQVCARRRPAAATAGGEEQTGLRGGPRGTTHEERANDR